jgi:hypothetical protein
MNNERIRSLEFMIFNSQNKGVKKKILYFIFTFAGESDFHRDMKSLNKIKAPVHGAKLHPGCQASIVRLVATCNPSLFMGP